LTFAEGDGGNRVGVDSASDENCLITTLSTEDGFEVSFGLPAEACRSLGWVLKDEADAMMRADEMRADDAASVSRKTACLN